MELLNSNAPVVSVGNAGVNERATCTSSLQASDPTKQSLLDLRTGGSASQ